MPSEGLPYSVNRSSRSASDAALRGASLAFAKQPPPKPPKPDTYSGSNGALAAAMKVGSSNNRLQSPTEQPSTQLRTQSQSLLAANIAASRSPSVSPRHTGPQDIRPRTQFTTVSKRRSTSALSRHSSSSSAESSVQVPVEDLLRNYVRSGGNSKPLSQPNGQLKLLDTRSIPSKKAYIGVIEKENPKKVTPSNLRVNMSLASPAERVPPEIKSPKPIRLSGNFISEEDRLIKALSGQPANVSTQNRLNPPDAAYRNDIQEGRRNDQVEDLSSDDSFVSASDYQETVRSRNSKKVPAFGASGQRFERSTPPALQRLPLQPPTKRTITPHMTGDALANAIVASSLASSRAASPATASNPPPVPAPRRHRHSFFSYHPEPQYNKRSPSPMKGLKRHTMRKDPQSDEEDDSSHRRGHKHLVKKHPHKHHEGDRKRWRDEITERERKRYLAVWASNKGVHTSNARVSHDASLGISGKDLGSEAVCNLVVRDVFSRSRLGDDVLGEVYSLVNRDDTGGLSREEFVVGLWLIDQRLKGRKLPIKVSPSVWESVVGRGGWKVPRHRR